MASYLSQSSSDNITTEDEQNGEDIAWVCPLLPELIECALGVRIKRIDHWSHFFMCLKGP
jgi:hypothetical protein